MSRIILNKLKKFFFQFEKEDSVLVVIDADPDSIASAMAIKRILWRKVAQISISNINKIDRPDNLAMVRLLNVKLINIHKINKNNYNKFIIVDSQPSHNKLFEQFKYNAIIDHHPIHETYKDLYVDIRPGYGANATIMTGYLKALKIKPSSKLATGLFHAIKTDTSNFERHTQIEDIRAFQFIFKYVNITLARNIEHAELKHNYLKYFAKAFENKKLNNGKIFAHIGKINNPDLCVIIADFFMKIDIAKWSIISGIYEKKLIVIYRNDGIRKNAGTIAKKMFDDIGSAGGHKSMARAEIEIKNLKKDVDILNKTKVTDWLIKKFNQKSR